MLSTIVLATQSLTQSLASAFTVRRLRTAAIVAMVVGLCSLLLLGGAAHPARAQEDDYQTIIDDSKTETDGLLIYSSLSDATWAPLIAAFNEKYPWIEVTNVESTNFDVFDSYYTEIDAGSRTADLLISSDLIQWVGLLAEGQFQEYISVEDASMPDFAKDEDHLYLLASNPTVLIWNKQQVEAELDSLQSLATLIESNPTAYVGKIGTLSASRSVTGFELYWHYLKQKGDVGWDLLARLGNAMPVTTTSSEKLVESVLAGNLSVGFFVEASAIAPYLEEDSDLGWSPITDGMPVVEYQIGMTQEAQSPNSAKLFIDFALSAEGQTALAESGLPAYREDLAELVAPHEDLFFNGVAETDQIFADVDNAPKSEDEQLAFIERWTTTFKIK